MGHLEVGFEQENPNVVGQTSGLTVAIPPVSLAVTDRHPEDARTGRPEVRPTLVVVTRRARGNAGRGNGLAAKLFLLYLMEGSDREPFIRTVSSYGDEENIICLATAAGHVGSQRNLLRCEFRVPWRARRAAHCLQK